MKRFFAIFLAVMIVFSFAVTPIYAFNLGGDANADSKINLLDVTSILKYIAKWDIDINELNADVTGDGAVNLSDVTLILQKIAGWNVSFNNNFEVDNDTNIGEWDEV